MPMWVDEVGPFRALDPGTLAMLRLIAPRTVAKGSVLFREGDAPSGFLVLLDGHIEVYLIGRSGREMLLYDVRPGQTCIQTTVCLLGDQSYTGEAVAATETTFVQIPKSDFTELMNGSPVFRAFVFRAFGDRLKDVVSVLERVSFVPLEARLAADLLRRTSRGDVATATHHELAVAIGSVREVVSRRLETFQKAGLVRLDRGKVTVIDRKGLLRVSTDGTVT